MRRAGLALLVPLLAAACGDIPQPFRHEGRNPALTPAASRGVVVVPPDDGPRAHQLAEAVVTRLLTAEVPASIRPVVPGAWTIAARTEATPAAMIFRWRLSNDQGDELGGLEQAVPLATWERGSARTLEIMATEVADKLAGPLAGEPAVAAAASSASTPAVRLVPPAGLPGDGDKALAAAMRRMLASSGLALAEGEAPAVFQVKAQATVTRGRPGEDILSVSWIVTGKDGETLGTASQQGPVPKDRLSGAWGGLAADVAAGGAEGVVEIIRAAMEK